MSVTVMVVVQAYEKRENGELYALAPIPARDVAHGIGLARSLNCAGAIVLSRTGNPDLGEWQGALILLTVGDVPEVRNWVSRDHLPGSQQR